MRSSPSAISAAEVSSERRARSASRSLVTVSMRARRSMSCFSLKARSSEPCRAPGLWMMSSLARALAITAAHWGFKSVTWISSSCDCGWTRAVICCASASGVVSRSSLSITARVTGWRLTSCAYDCASIVLMATAFGFGLALQMLPPTISVACAW